MFLRRYVRLRPGEPLDFTCEDGWHESIVEIGEYFGELRSGVDEQKLRPPRIDERWPLHCAHCEHEFTNRDRYQFFTRRLPEIDDETD